MIDAKPRYEFCDLNIVPCVTTPIESRSECSPYVDDKKRLLPLFAAPMSSVVDDTNYQDFYDNGITPIVHRNVAFNKRIELTQQRIWCAWSLDEFNDVFCKDKFRIYDNLAGNPESDDSINAADGALHALVDIANGHMQKGLRLARECKDVAHKHNVRLEIMVGNIANPQAYIEYAKAGVDYCRIGIGGGGFCLTTPNTGVHYPMASLIDEIRQLRDKYVFENCMSDEPVTVPKIVADGSIRIFGDINVALACGADYVMIGTVFASCIEAAGMTVYQKSMKPCDLKRWADEEGKGELDEQLKRFIIDNFEIGKLSYGMSSKKAQMEHIKMQGKDIKDVQLKTSEGKTDIVPVKYTLAQWTDNFKSFLKSAMSYTDCLTLEEFCHGDVQLVPKSSGQWTVVNK